MKENCIGLFGTCGNSKWREIFIDYFKETDINYYNPQVKEWNASMAVIEAKHLANDSIILFPITNETYAVGSLSEVGFSVLNALRLDRRDFVVMIQQSLSDELMEDKERATESLRARALVYQHLKAQNLPNIYLVENLTDMLEVSKVLYLSNVLRNKVSKYSLKNNYNEKWENS